MSVSEIDLGNVRVYGCGGCGINIAKNYLGYKTAVGYSHIHPAFIDTSKSNLKNIDSNNPIFVLEGTDGSGKVRAENADAINKNIKKILVDIPPMDFNIVVFSGSGGSGSVAASLLVAELASRHIPVIAIVVGSEESVITCNNTVKTLKSLDSLARQKQVPITMFYEYNTQTTKRSEVDASVFRTIGNLALLTSKQNSELDSKDIENWVFFDKTTPVEPCLAYLDIKSNSEVVKQIPTPISIASLYRNPDQPMIDVQPDYQCTGYTENFVGEIDQTHFIIELDSVGEIYKAIEKRLSAMEELRNSRVINSSLTDANDKTDDSGLIL